MGILKRVFDHKGAPVLAAVFVALFIAESKRRLRQRKMSRLKRVEINAVVAVPSFSLLRFLLLPVMVWVAIKNKKLKFGFNYLYNAHPVDKKFCGFFNNGLH